MPKLFWSIAFVVLGSGIALARCLGEFEIMAPGGGGAMFHPLVKVYISTCGRSVWHGQVTTEPANLDIPTPEMELR